MLYCIEIIYFDYSIHNVIFGICNRRNDSLQSIAVCMRAHTQLQLGPTGDHYVVCNTSAVCLLHFSCSTGVSSSSLAAYGSSLGSPCSVLSRAISQHYQETRLTHVHMHTPTHPHTHTSHSNHPTNTSPLSTASRLVWTVLYTSLLAGVLFKAPSECTDIWKLLN